MNTYSRILCLAMLFAPLLPARAADEPPREPDPTLAEIARAVRMRDVVLPALTQSDAARAVAGLPTSLLSGLDLAAIQQALEDAESVKPLDRPIDTIPLTLEDAVATALEQGLRIRIAELDRDAARTGVREAKAIFHPVVGVGYSRDETTERDVAGDTTQTVNTWDAFLSEFLPTGASFTIVGQLAEDRSDPLPDPLPEDHDGNLSITATQPLLRGGRVFVAKRDILDAKFDLNIQEAQLNAEILRVVAETKTAYYNAILFEQIIAATEEAIRRDDILIEASESLQAAGIGTKRDVFSAQILQASDRARLVAAQADQQLAVNDLLDILGLPIDSKVELVDKEIPFAPVPMQLAEWVRIALESRPEVLQAEEELKQSELNLRVARNAVLPQGDLFGTYTRFDTAFTRAGAFELDNETWSVGAAVSIPLGNVAARAQRSRARIQYQRLERQLESIRRAVEIEVRAAAIKLEQSTESIKPLRQGLEQAQQKLEVAKARFGLGLATNLDITDAQESLLDAETDLLTAIIDYNIGLAELEASIARAL